MTQTARQSLSASRTAAWTAIGIVLIAVNLRPAIVAVAPLVGELRVDMGITAATAGILTAIPLLCFALLSPFAPAVARWWGLEKTVFLSIVLLCTGIGIRWIPTLPSLFLGTALIGIALTAGNVLLPGLIKQDFANRPGLMMGLYSVGLFTGAALAGGLTVPIARAAGWDWHAALAMWGLLGVAGALAWSPQLMRRRSQADRIVVRTARIWQSPLAWAVAGFMGLQSLHYYTVTAWLPEILIAEGASSAAAGLYLALASMAAVITSLLVPIFAARMNSQRLPGMLITGCAFLGVCGILFTPGLTVLAILLLGLAQGGAIGLALLLTVMRTTNPVDTSSLSGMSQSVGYLLAAVGPIFMGFLYDWSSGWQLPLVLLALLLFPQCYFAYVAGTNKKI